MPHLFSLNIRTQFSWRILFFYSFKWIVFKNQLRKAFGHFMRVYCKQYLNTLLILPLKTQFKSKCICNGTRYLEAAYDCTKVPGLYMCVGRSVCSLLLSLPAFPLTAAALQDFCLGWVRATWTTSTFCQSAEGKINESQWWKVFCFGFSVSKISTCVHKRKQS